MNKSILVLLLLLLGTPMTLLAQEDNGGVLTRDARQEGFDNYITLFAPPDAVAPQVVYFGPSSEDAQSNPGDALARDFIFKASPDPEGLAGAPVVSKNIVWRTVGGSSGDGGQQEPLFDFTGSGIYDHLY